MSRNPALRDRIAAAVLEAAAVVLAEQGEAASMADIAAAAGVGRATLYRYFPTREVLLRALAQAAVDKISDRLVEADLDTVPVAEGIARLTRAFLTTGSKYIAFMRSAAKPLDRADVERQIGGPLRAVFRRGAADGTLRGDLPGEALLALYIGLLEAAIPLSTADGLGVERASAAVTTLFLDGARTPVTR